MNAYAGAIEALQLYNSLLEQAGKISPGSRDYADIERGLSISYQTASLTIAFAVLEEIRLVAARLDSSEATTEAA